MPLKAPTSCSTPGCPNKAIRLGRCISHAAQQAQRYEAARGTSAERGYGSEWRKRRHAYLLENPWCVMCYRLGKEQYATEVDHVVPKSQGGADEPENWQPLCHEHHSAKTMRENNRMRRG